MPSLDIDKTDEAALKLVCEQRWQEGPTLDFKRELPAKDDAARREFLKDVCAFANADGGLILFGIQDADGIAEKIVPITTEGQDDAILRLGQIIDASVEPRLRGWRLHPVAVAGGYALLLKVPPSFDGPHRYVVNNASRFVMRSGRHTIDLTYQQLKSAFGNTDKLLERAREFRELRVTVLPTLPSPHPMRPGPVMFVHVIPIEAMSRRVSVDVLKLYNDYYASMVLSDWGGGNRVLNLDGVLAHASDENQTQAFTRLFRSGIVEMGRFMGLTISDKKIVPSLTIAKFMREAIPKAIQILRKSEMSGPAIVGFSIARMEGFQFAKDRYTTSEPLDRSSFTFPETWIDDLESPPPVDEIVKPILDLLWQAYGEPACTYYDDNGTWAPK